jgi:hypothetical protein
MMTPLTDWWEWARKPVDSTLTISAVIHRAVMVLSPEERRASRSMMRRVYIKVGAIGGMALL